MSDASGTSGDRQGAASTGRDWAQAVATTLGLTAPVEPLTGRDRLTLDDPAQAWLVLAGSLNVFYAETVEEGEGAGRRHGLAQVDTGAIAFGLPRPDGGGRVVGVPGDDARIVAVDLVQVAARTGELAEHLGPAIESWVGELAGSSLPPPPPQQVETLLHPGESIGPVADVKLIEAADGLVWARPITGSLGYLGVATVAQGRAVPLATGAWAPMEAGTQVAGLSTLDWLAGDKTEGDWRADLASFHAVVLQRFLGDLAESRDAVWQRLAQRRDAERQSFDGAIGSLASVGLTHEPAEAAAPSHPLIGAADLVAGATGIEIALPQGGMEAVARAADPLARLADIAGFHTLRIELEGDWWRRDQGALLAYRGDKRQPTALLPTAPGRYDAVDPVTKRREAVTPAVAKSFARDAAAFVALMPGHPLGVRDVLRNGLHGLSADWRRLLIGMALSGIVAMSIPLIVEQIIGTAVPEADRGALLVLALAMVAVAVAGAGFSVVQSLALLRIEGRAAARIHQAVFARMLRLPTEFFRNYTAGDLSVRLRGVEEMRQLLSDNTLFIIIALVNGLISLGLMLYYEMTLGLTVAAVAIVLGLLNYRFGGRVVSLQRRLLHLRGDVEADVVQNIDGITELRTNNAERRAFARWSAKFTENQAAAFDAGRFTNAGETTNAVFPFMSVLAIVLAIGVVSGQFFAFFGQEVSWDSVAATGLDGAINAAQFMAFYTAFGQFSLAITQIVQSTLNLTALVPTYDRLRPLLETAEEHQEGDEDPGELRGDIEVRDAQFRYAPDTPLVLRGVSLTAKAGQFVAVVGPSGAGKSSLMRLILGFDAPEAGSVFLDGMDLRQLNKRAVRRNFGVVLQAVKVMTGTIYENITSGTDMSEEAAWWAAEQVGFAEDIRRMPDGIHTMLTDGGSTLSGGQCQRLMLARAIIRQPRIMLLDEATSALDNEVQSIVTQAMDNLNCTRVVIAHRLSTIANADLIYVIDAGRLVEHGTYDELMRLDGVFAELARRQLAE